MCATVKKLDTMHHSYAPASPESAHEGTCLHEELGPPGAQAWQCAMPRRGNPPGPGGMVDSIGPNIRA